MDSFLSIIITMKTYNNEYNITVQSASYKGTLKQLNEVFVYKRE